MTTVKFNAQKKNGTSWGGEYSGNIDKLLDSLFKKGADEVAVVGPLKTDVYYAETYRSAGPSKQNAKSKFELATEDAAVRYAHRCWIFPLIGYALFVLKAIVGKYNNGLTIILLIASLVFILGGLWRWIGAILNYKKFKITKLFLPISLGGLANAPVFIIISMAIIGIWYPKVFQLLQ